ncbi:haloacid dehalogenase type II [Pseudonocardia phyllosphaerae]|uniref:haloacid dehalogenase type II n=1 Tax=Pseudonocardia phyllosphaerae TaxID=3390502 RepID=UPI00397E4285
MAITTVVFDVNETLSDLGPLHEVFRELGAPDGSAPLWFTTTLREGMGLAAGGEARPFAEIGRSTAAELLRRNGADPGRADRVIEAFLGLPVHPDVHPGIAALRAAGLRLVTLSNGAAAVAERLLGDHGLRAMFDAVLSVDDGVDSGDSQDSGDGGNAGVWKPAPHAYTHALTGLGVAPEEAVMVAVHPWDLHGAARVGMATAWLDRDRATWPGYLTPPTFTVAALPELAAHLD